MTGTPGQRVRAGVVDTRVIGKPDQFDGDPMKYADWSFKLRSDFVAVDQRYQLAVDDDRDIVDTIPRQRRKRTQHTYVLHSGDDNCRSRIGRVSQCRRERVVRGVEAVRDGVGAQASDEVCGTPDERAGVQIPRRHSNQASSEQRQNHKLESDGRGDSRDHANTTVHRQSNDTIAARSECEEQRQGQRQQRQRQRTSRAKTRPRMQRTNPPRKHRAMIRESASTAKRQAT